MYKSNLYRYRQSSEEEDSSDEQKISPVFAKSDLFSHSKPPLIKSGNYKNQNKQQEKGNEVEEQQSHLRPKLKIENELEPDQQKEQRCMENISGLMGAKKHSISQANINKKAINAAYTFKLKSPNLTRKKNDPVALFQQTSTSWKKDKFLTNRADLKEGRKLELQKRNKQYV